MITILLTGVRAPVALDFIHSFSQRGCRVVVADSLRFPYARWSNRVHTYYHLPSPRHQTEQFVSKLQRIVKRERVDHLIPICEEVFYISQYQNAFGCRVWVSNFQLMTALHSKYEFSQLAASYLPVPSTVLLKDFQDWKASERYVFKPVYSRFATATVIRKRLTANFFSQDEQTRWVAQRYVAGTEICVYSVWNHGQLQAITAYRPVYRAGTGAAIFFSPFKHPAMFDLVRTFGEQITFTGQLSFDVILDQADNPYFIECNPRATSGAHLLDQNIAAAFLDHQPHPRPSTADYGIKYALGILKPHTLFQKRVRRAKDVVFRKDDLIPFFLQPLSVLEITYVMIRRRISWLVATTWDIEWNGHER